MGIKNIKNNNNRDSLLSYFVSGKYKQFHSAEKGIVDTGINATGGSVFTPGDGYTYHVFTATGVFTVSSIPPSGGFVDAFIVGGGGGGGAGNRGAGAGAGGLIYRPALPVNIDFYNVFIGAGGASGTYNGPSAGFDRKGSPGSNSTFGAPQAGPWTTSSLVALGGGRGGGGDGTNNGGTGGSGGSSWYPNYPAVAGIQPTEPTIPADSRSFGFGNPSGASSSSPVYGGGGGGAGAAGRPANDGTYAGGGGAGKEYTQFGSSNIPGLPFSPYDGKFAGGGTSADYPDGAAGGQTRGNPESVPFGGGSGNNNLTTPGSNPVLNGAINTGGGGGSGGSGGAGVTIIRYATSRSEDQRIYQFHYTGSDQAFTVPTANTYTSATIYAWGGGGGGGYNSGAGGGGGFSQATIPVTPGAAFNVVVGGGGDTRAAGAGTGSPAYGGGGTAGPAGYGGNGGGLSGIFYGGSSISFDSTSQPRAIVIAGGGGGASWESAAGGAGGGTTGVAGGAGSSPGGSGGTQSAGGPGYGPTGTGSALLGGSSNDGDAGGSGAGGGGYFGGGAGTNNNPGSGGGGGSGYVGGHPLYVTSGTTTTQGSGTSVANSTSPFYSPGVGNGGATGANVGQSGRVVIVLNT